MLKYVVGIVVLFALGGPAIAATPDALCKPSVRAAPETANSKMTTRIGELPAGYIQEEYFVSCELEGKPYTTLIQVRRPGDAGKASGIVMAEVWHWSDIWTVYPKIWTYL